jgi:hypothetical protein
MEKNKTDELSSYTGSKILKPCKIKSNSNTKSKKQPFPSFAYKCRESKFKNAFKIKKLGKKSPLRILNNKIHGKSFMEKLGLPVPKLLSAPTRLRDLSFPIDDCFIVKPTYSKNSWGVFLLDRFEGGFINRINGEKLDEYSLKLQMAAVAKSRELKDSWHCEEFIKPHVDSLNRPDDLKFYAFHGRVELILQKRNILDSRYFCWYNRDLTLVKTGKYENKVLDAPMLPEYVKIFLDDVEKASLHIPAPFMRIDFLLSEKTCVFGEFTPWPGGSNKFNTRWDRVLGEAWEKAEAMMDGARTDLKL